MFLGPLEVTDPGGLTQLVGTCRGVGNAPRWNPGASWRKWCPDSGRMNGQAETGRMPMRGGGRVTLALWGVRSL